jgi:hypothetical protein
MSADVKSVLVPANSTIAQPKVLPPDAPLRRQLVIERQHIESWR